MKKKAKAGKKATAAKKASKPKKAAPKKAAPKNATSKLAKPKSIKKPKVDSSLRPLDRVFGNGPVIEKESAKIRVLVGKAGLDGHDRGAKVIARAFRDAGFEVVYTGLHQTAEMIVNTAIQEDVDVLGLSILSGAHNYLVPEIAAGLKKQGVTLGKDMLLVIGGIIPESDFDLLRKNGVNMVFTPGSSVDSIVEYVRKHVQTKA